MISRITTIALLAILVTACSNADNAPADVAVNGDAAYFVFNYRISNRDAYDLYLAEVPKTLDSHSAEIVVADFESDVIEGNAGTVTVVLRFASKEAARGWYQSPEYQEIIRLRTGNSSGIATLASAAEN